MLGYLGIITTSWGKIRLAEVVFGDIRTTMAHFPTRFVSPPHPGERYPISTSESLAPPSDSASAANFATYENPSRDSDVQHTNVYSNQIYSESAQESLESPVPPSRSLEECFKAFYRRQRSLIYAEEKPYIAIPQIIQEFSQGSSGISLKETDKLKQWAESADKTFRNKRSLQKAAECDPRGLTPEQLQRERSKQTRKNVAAQEAILDTLDPQYFDIPAEASTVSPEAASAYLRQHLQQQQGISVSRRRLEKRIRRATDSEPSSEQLATATRSASNLQYPTNQQEAEAMYEQGRRLMATARNWQEYAYPPTDIHRDEPFPASSSYGDSGSDTIFENMPLQHVEERAFDPWALPQNP